MTSGEKKLHPLLSWYKRMNAARRRAFGRWTVRHAQGATLLLDRSSALDRHVMKAGSWEAEQIAFLEQLARSRHRAGREAVFLDVGSYFGLYSLCMWRTGLFGHLVAFEANPVNFCHLQASLLLNECVGEIETRNVAVSDAAGEIGVSLPNARDRGNSPVGGAADFTVRSTTLDAEFPDLRDCLVVMKMDIEGHEEKALRGMTRLAATNEIVLQIEVFRENEAAVFPLLAAMGLVKVHEIYPDHWFARG